MSSFQVFAANLEMRMLIQLWQVIESVHCVIPFSFLLLLCPNRLMDCYTGPLFYFFYKLFESRVVVVAATSSFHHIKMF